ncbi:hypothetical protein [Nioella nitratireducens]|uniref:hypothetical protein n=1 Tax=Nioella nitratireducens TaxID=1287720 RepID=UPI0008FCF71B|nr:hypothetical protein [Nioella nitratireducens]
MSDASDPKGLVRESYRIEGITEGECRSIFMDWALSLSDPDPLPQIAALLERYGADHPDHPMTGVLRAGLETPPAAKRRGGRAARVPSDD